MERAREPLLLRSGRLSAEIEVYVFVLILDFVVVKAPLLVVGLGLLVC